MLIDKIMVAMVFNDFVVFNTKGEIIHSTGAMKGNPDKYKGSPIAEVVRANKFGERLEFMAWYNENINNLKD